MSRFSLRTRLTILVTVAAAITLAVLTAGFNLLLRSNLDADANRVLQARASAALEGISVRNGSVQVKESPDRAAPDTQVWVYSGGTAVERPAGRPRSSGLRTPWPAGPRPMPRTPRRTFGCSRCRSRRGVVALERSSRRSRWSRTSTPPRRLSAPRCSMPAAALLLVVVATRLVVTRALRPVAQMTAEAAEWSEHDLDHPFQRRGAVRRAHTARRDLRQHARSSRVEPATRAAPLR